MRRLAYVGIGAIALLGGTLALVGDPDAGTPPAAAPAIAAAPSVAEAELRTELRQLRGRVAALDVRVSDVAPGAQPEAEAVAEVAPPPREAVARFEQVLATTIAGEADDPSWSRPTEARIAEALRAPTFAGTQLRAARCRRTMCQIELGHVDPDAQDAFLARVTHTPPFNTRGYIKPSVPGQPAATEVYVARTGHSLPAAD
jgi:hypothetical protein